MKKVLKIVIGVIVTLVVVVLMIGPSDPIVLSEEEEIAFENKQITIYQDIELKGFNTVDLDGNDVDDSIFTNYDLTMINLWYTGCSPCIAEMPDIQKVKDTVSININVITICNEEKSKYVKMAKKIMNEEASGVQTLIPDEVLNDQLMNRTTCFPTTIFVDNQGKIVGNVFNQERTSEGYLNAIDERLNILSEKE
jgi:thiol-disulfide isomerase/thioredoxin